MYPFPTLRSPFAWSALTALLALSAFAETSDSDHYLQSLAETQNFSLGRPIQAMPTADGKSVIFLRSDSPRDRATGLYRFDVASGETEQLAAPENLMGDQALSAEEKMRQERTRTKVTGITSFELSEDGGQIAFTLPGALFVYRLEAKRLVKLKTGAGNEIDPTFSPDGRTIAYIRDYNLFVYDLETDQERAITTGGTETKSFGTAEFVAQEEMDRRKGFWWLPDSKTIVYQVNDSSKVEVWYVGDPSAPQNPPYPSRYPRPGKDNVDVRLAIVNAGLSDDLSDEALPSGSPHLSRLAKSEASGVSDDRAKSGTANLIRWLEWDRSKYPYLVRVSPTKFGPLTITVETRDQRELALLEVNPETGATQPLLKENDPDWVNIDQSVPVWLPSHEFVWTSERNGAWQLELRHPDGTLDRVTVSPDKGLQHFSGLTGSYLFFLAGKNPSESELWRANLNDPELTRLASGFHTISVSENGASVLADTVRAPDSLAKTLVRRTDGSVLGELPSVAEEPPYYPRVEFTDDEFVSCIVRPRNFDRSKKYPVIVEVYAGPGFSQVQKIAGPYLIDQWLADQGFVVVSFDGRGTPGHGRDWERAIYQKFGEIPLADQVSALTNFAARHPELDLNRVGITGWSFGGYMSALAVLRRPDVFKAAAAGAPVTDWLDYDTHYTERYLGLPGDAVYAASSLIGDASKLDRPLLIIHGTADDNVYFRHSLKLIDAFEKAGRSFQFLPIAGSTHMVLDPGLRVQIEKRTVEFFKATL